MALKLLIFSFYLFYVKAPEIQLVSITHLTNSLIQSITEHFIHTFL